MSLKTVIVSIRYRNMNRRQIENQKPLIRLYKILRIIGIGGLNNALITEYKNANFTRRVFSETVWFSS